MENNIKGTILLAIDTNTAGGGERVISVLANYFVKNNYKVILVNSDFNSHFYKLDSNIKNIKMCLSSSTGGRLSKLVRFIKKVGKLTKIISNEKPDVIVAFLFNMEIPAIIAAKLTGVPIFTSVRNSANYYSRCKREIRKFFYRFSNGVIFQSKTVRDNLDFNRIKNKTVIPNPLSVEEVEYSPVPYKCRKKWIINVGRLTEQKNQKLLIDSFVNIQEAYPDFELHIFGDGDMKSELSNYISCTPVAEKVILEGNVKDVIKNNADAMIFVISSNMEGFPNALVEAMAYGIPVISTQFDSGVADELIINGVNGFLCPVGDVEKMTETLVTVLDKRETLDKISTNEIDIRNKLNVDNICKQWESFIFNKNGD